MILIRVHKRSPWRAHAVATHYDYQRHPSRSWTLAECVVDISPGQDAREVMTALVRELAALFNAPPADAAAGAGVAGQLELW